MSIDVVKNPIQLVGLEGDLDSIIAEIGNHPDLQEEAIEFRVMQVKLQKKLVKLYPNFGWKFGGW